jgi:hypothetical protein
MNPGREFNKECWHKELLSPAQLTMKYCSFKSIHVAIRKTTTQGPEQAPSLGLWWRVLEVVGTVTTGEQTSAVPVELWYGMCRIWLHLCRTISKHQLYIWVMLRSLKDYKKYISTLLKDVLSPHPRYYRNCESSVVETVTFSRRAGILHDYANPPEFPTIAQHIQNICRTLYACTVNGASKTCLQSIGGSHL